MKKIILLFSFILLLTPDLFAKTINNTKEQHKIQIETNTVDGIMVSGEIDQDTTWSDTVYIVGDITVNDGVTLTIDAGSKVYFEGHYMLAVQGQLLALGTPQDSILFTILDTTQFTNMDTTAGGWYGIRFDETPATNDSSKLIYCKLEYGKAVGDTYEDGGAIYIKNYSKVLISDCLISHNRSNNDGGGIYSRGESVIKNTIILYNYAKEYGGGVAFGYPGPTVKNSIICYNIADDGGGGGIECYGSSSPDILNSIITNNSSYLRGGGIRCAWASSPTIINCVISNNDLDGIYSYESDPMILNTTIVNNKNYGIYLYEDTMPLKKNAVIDGQENNYNLNNKILRSSNIYNTILWGNSSNEVYVSSGDYLEPDFYYCDIKGGINGITGNSYVGDYENNIDVEPMFVSPSVGAGIEFDGLNADWSLQSSSICINHGIPDTTGLNIPDVDLAGNPRIYNGNLPIIDIGAYEYQGEPDQIPEIIVEPLNLSFGLCTVDSISSIKYITISNIGHSTLEIDSIVAPIGFKVKREDDPEFSSIIDSFSIATYHDTLIHVVFKPTVAQNYSGDIIIKCNDLDEDTVLVNVSGIGTSSPVVSGVIDTDTMWDADTIKVVGSITVLNGVTLTINPGTLVKFFGNYSLNIQGRILALGTENDSIVFTSNSNSNSNKWDGIIFDGTLATNDSSKFEFCKIEKCHKYEANSVAGGAFLILNFSKLTISNCKISDNSLSSSSSGMWYCYSYGGGIHLHNSSIKIINSEICNNNVDDGADYSYGGGLYCSNSCPTIYNTTICNNSADWAGGIYCGWDSNPLLKNVLIYDNHSDGLYCYGSSPHILNSTISSNSYGIRLYSYCPNTSSSTPNIYNTILWDNSNSQVYLNGEDDDPNFYYCDIQGGLQAFEGPGVQYYNGDYLNNIDEDPLFENIYHLSLGSPCIDAGTPDTTGLHLPPWDLDGNVRIWDGNGDSLSIVDMGCYEFGAPLYDIDEPETNAEFQLNQNYPNPFSNSTNISFKIPRFCEDLQLKIYNIKGQLIRKIYHSNTIHFSDEVVWDGKDDQGRILSNGIYLYQLTGKNYTSKIMKMILLR